MARPKQQSKSTPTKSPVSKSPKGKKGFPTQKSKPESASEAKRTEIGSVFGDEQETTAKFNTKGRSQQRDGFSKRKTKEEQEDYEQDEQNEYENEEGDNGGFDDNEIEGSDDSEEENDAEDNEDGVDEKDSFSKVSSKRKSKPGSFQSMNLSDQVIRAIVKKGYRLPTPIQRKAIPILLSGSDVVAMARTGSGKTAAFLIPMIEKLKRNNSLNGARGLVLSPTRELVFQTLKFTRDLSKFTDLRCCCIVGGDAMEEQFEELAKNPDILIATPGRLLHLLTESALSLSKIEYVVFDEADRLFEMGFQEQLFEILKKLPSNRQTTIFSATLPQSLVDFAKAGLQSPEIVRLDADTKLSENLKIAFFNCRIDDKPAALLYLLKSIIPADDLTIIFTATKHHVEYLYTVLKGARIDASIVYGSLDMTARKINVAKFRNAKTKVMIVTDVAARGIDIPLLNNVINYDFPCKSKLFVHRVGRAARAGRTGTAYSLVSTDELPYMIDLHLYLGRPLLCQRPDDMNPVVDTNVYYGQMPQYVLDLENEVIKSISRENSDVDSTKKVSQNAYKLYYKTRALPSTESVRRAKELPRDKIHPDLLLVTDLKLQSHSDFVTQMKSFRPSQTVFEFENSGKRKAKSLEILEVMKKKRERDEHIIESERKKRALSKNPATVTDPLDPGSFKDQQFYIPLRPKNELTEKSLSVNESLGGKGSDRIEDLVLEMVPDERDSLVLKQRKKQWDRKKKKFVNVDAASDKSKMIRTESGNKVMMSKKLKTNRYESWKEKQNGKGPNKASDGVGSGSRKGKSELKNKDQIRKERKVKAKQASWLKFKKSQKEKKPRK